MPLKLKEILQTNIIRLKIPPSGRQTSWLFKSMIQGVERGFTEKQLQVLSTQNSHEAESITALML